MKAPALHFFRSEIAIILFFIIPLLHFPVLLSGQNSQTFTSSGSYTVPAGVTVITVECWGGGGSGGGQSANNSAGGGGGAGGAYAKKVMSVVPGTSYTVTVAATKTGSQGAGAEGNPSWFGTVSTVYAQGGAGGAAPSGGTVSGGIGSSALSIGDFVYAGGDGANGTSAIGGAGGGGAGSTGPGGDASGTTSGSGTATGGGNGGAGRSSTGGNGNAGSTYGGGGGGAFVNNTTNRTGGNGAAGRVIVSWACPTISTYPFTESFDGTTFPPSCWSLVNAGTGNNWTRSTSTPYAGAGTMLYGYSSTAAANAWAFTPGFELQAGHNYTISFYQKVASATYPEKLKVTVGTDATAASQTTILWNNAGGTSLTNIAYILRTAGFVCPSNDTYYFAFNCYSDADMYNLFVDEVAVADAGISCDFTASRTAGYTNQNITFTDASAGGGVTSWAWNFGEGASPASASTQGPHEVNYSTSGSKTVSLTINGSTTTTKSGYINIAQAMPPRQLAASVTGFSDVSLSWLSPALNEGFEPYDDFDLSFGSFTFRDVDGGATYAIQDVTFPNSAYTGSFIDFNPSLTVPALTGAWDAHSGKKYAACFAALTASAPNNDWIITPKITVSGGEQLSFWAKSVTDQYGLERFKVGISATGTEPADFTIISAGSYVEAPLEWTQFTYSLSAYEGQQIYIAINCISNDAFVFMLDDLVITGGPSQSVAQVPVNMESVPGLKPVKQWVNGPSVVAPDQNGNTRSFTSYKIYRNGSEIADVAGFSYTDPDLVPGTYNYTVAAVYSDPLAISASAGPSQVITDITRWTGAINSDWQNAGNWRTGQMPAPSGKIGIPGTGITNFPILTQQGIECENLTLKPGASLQINPLATLSVNGILTNNAGISGLIIKSDATGTGSLLNSSSGVNALVERYIEAADWGLWDDGWHFIASPVAAQTINSVSGFVTSGPPSDDYDLYAWHEPGNVWVNFKNTTSTPTWNDVNNNSPDFLVGKGYMASYQVTDTKEFKGVMNVNDVAVTGLGISTGSNQSWHLLGNPYASALAWDGTWTTSNISGIAKIWSEEGKAYQDLTPADVANSVIPSGNGFMVEVSSGTGSLTIPAAKRIHSSKEFQKSSSLPVIVLTARNNDHPSFQQSTLVFNPMATNGFDVLYDGHFLPGYAPQFYSVANGDFLSTNTLPSVESETSIPFSFIKNEGTSFSISARVSENFPATVYLKDKQTGADHDLSNSPVYHFTSSSGDGPERFQVHFKALGTVNDFADSRISVFSSRDKIIVSAATAFSADVRVFNLKGQQVLETTIKNQPYTELNAQALSEGVYVVTFFSNESVFSRKIVLMKQ
ncbi:MAG: choice-of-anchor J domain-containing protein [Bacteroidales bacterium]|nr:choice-of-anchor J domain-containing protein [Bacteroidales bacterium]